MWYDETLEAVVAGLEIVLGCELEIEDEETCLGVPTGVPGVPAGLSSKDTYWL